MDLRRPVHIASVVFVLALLLSFAKVGAQRGAGPAPAPAPAASPELTALARQSLAKLDGELNVPGLKEAVEIVRDRWGVPHIYAKKIGRASCRERV